MHFASKKSMQCHSLTDSLWFYVVSCSIRSFSFILCIVFESGVECTRKIDKREDDVFLPITFFIFTRTSSFNHQNAHKWTLFEENKPFVKKFIWLLRYRADKLRGANYLHREGELPSHFWNVQKITFQHFTHNFFHIYPNVMYYSANCTQINSLSMK